MTCVGQEHGKFSGPTSTLAVWWVFRFPQVKRARWSLLHIANPLVKLVHDQTSFVTIREGVIVDPVGKPAENTRKMPFTYHFGVTIWLHLISTLLLWKLKL